MMKSYKRLMEQQQKAKAAAKAQLEPSTDSMSYDHMYKGPIGEEPDEEEMIEKVNEAKRHIVWTDEEKKEIEEDIEDLIDRAYTNEHADLTEAQTSYIRIDPILMSHRLKSRKERKTLLSTDHQSRKQNHSLILIRLKLTRVLWLILP